MINIVITDSGVGGLSILKMLWQKYRQGVHYIYASDSDNMPYGNKSTEQIRKLTIQNIERIKKYNPDIVIIACNTISETAGDIYLKFFDVPVLFVEPDTEKITLFGEDKSVLFCTVKTSESAKIAPLKEKFNNVVVPLISLAKDIEENIFNLENFHLEIDIKKYRKKRYIFLGCTHYLLIMNKFKKIFKNCIFFGGFEKIMTTIEKLLNNIELKGEKSQKTFIGSGNLRIERAFEKLIEEGDY